MLCSRTLDPKEYIVPLSADEIVEIHETLADWFASSEDPISPVGVRDRGLLESAAARPDQTVEGREAYKTLFSKAAALFHSLVNNHPFYNGNKRVALVAAQVALAQQNYWLEDSSDEEMFEFTRKAAAHELTENRADEIDYMTEWFDANCRKAIRGEHPLKYTDLKHHLRRFGYEMDGPDSEFIQIYKDGRPVERIIKQGIKGFRPYHTDYILGLRKRLGLTPENGIDSVRFYGHKGLTDMASQFIELRIEVMRRLAKT